MQNFKLRWDIQSNWQLFFPFLGCIGLLFSGYLISKRIAALFTSLLSTPVYTILTGILTLVIAYFLLKLTLKIFEKLATKWKVTYRWELIAIFIVFAITGSTAAKISTPIINALGMNQITTSGWIYWPIRIFAIFPVYQILLIIVGWLFGQFTFFWEFEKKMLRRFGFSKVFKE